MQVQAAHGSERLLELRDAAANDAPRGAGGPRRA